MGKGSFSILFYSILFYFRVVLIGILVGPPTAAERRVDEDEPTVEADLSAAAMDVATP